MCKVNILIRRLVFKRLFNLLRIYVASFQEKFQRFAKELNTLSITFFVRNVGHNTIYFVLMNKTFLEEIIYII